MTKATKKKLLVGGSLLVVAGVGGYFLWKYFKKKREEAKKNEEEALKITDQTPVVPQASSSPKPKPATKKPVAEKPIVETLKVGDSVVMSKPDYWWKKDKNEAYKYIKDTSGKNVFIGRADTGAYAGVIQSIPKTSDLVVVSNFTLRPSDDQGAKTGFNTFRVDKKSLKKQVASSFNGVTVSYQPSYL